jgi:AraC-like DNA-binding protein
MLDETNLAVQDIALQIGYENPLNFSRGFKNAFGISPTDYRQSAQIKGGQENEAG